MRFKYNFYNSSNEYLREKSAKRTVRVPPEYKRVIMRYKHNEIHKDRDTEETVHEFIPENCSQGDSTDFSITMYHFRKTMVAYAAKE